MAKQVKKKKSILRGKLLSSKWIPFLLGVILIGSTIVLYQSMKIARYEETQKQTVSNAKIFTNKIEEIFFDIENSLDDLAKTGSPFINNNASDWEMQAMFYTENITGVSNILWINDNMLIKKVIPYENEDFIVDYSSRDIVPAKNHIHVLLAVLNNNNINGFLLGDIDLEAVITENILSLQEGYILQIFKEDLLIYQSTNWDESKSDIEEIGDIILSNSSIYKLHIKPSNKTIKENNIRTTQLLGYGMFLSFAVICLLLLAQSSHRKSKLLSKTQEALIEKQKQLKNQYDLLEKQLKHRQKLESIGTLASGIAHEINNPINGIMNYSQLILDDKNLKENQSMYANEIIEETKRVSSLVQNLLNFSRKEKSNRSIARPVDIINRSVSLISTILKHDQIEFNVELNKDLPEIFCQSQQIQQVLINLLTNARDSLNEKYPHYNSNKLLKLTALTMLKENQHYVRIIIEDHGVGLSNEVKEKMYEQFFTTKEENKGTGLGLSISQNIVKEHKGLLTYESIVGEFTKFILDLPAKE